MPLTIAECLAVELSPSVFTTWVCRGRESNTQQDIDIIPIVLQKAKRVATKIFWLYLSYKYDTNEKTRTFYFVVVFFFLKIFTM